MNPRILRRASGRSIIVTLLLLLLASAAITVASAEVTELTAPPWVVQGETLSISGKAAPNEEVWIGSSFALSLPVSAEGEYSREFIGLDFPEGEKNFSVTAENIKEIEVSLSPVEGETVTITCSGQTMTVTCSGAAITYPLEESIDETGAVSFSLSLPASIDSLPPLDITGKKDIKITGEAADGATSVNLNSAMSIKVIADSNADFTLDIDTEGVPPGEFLITAGSKEVTVEVVSTEPTPTPSSDDGAGGSGSDVPDTTPTPTPTPSATPASTPAPTSTTTPAITSTPLPPTTTPQPTSIESEEGTESPKPSRIPGFELVGGIVALLIVSMYAKKIW